MHCIQKRDAGPTPCSVCMRVCARPTKFTEQSVCCVVYVISLPHLHSCAHCEGMMATLRSYQLRAVGWMLAREGAMSWPGSASCWRGQHPLWTSVWPEENSSKLCGELFYFNFHTGRCCTCVHVTCTYVRTYACKLCALPSVVAVHTSWPVGLWCDLNICIVCMCRCSMYVLRIKRHG